jgi:hypothetical protein
MAYSRSGAKNNWALFLLILAGIVIGGFLGELTDEISYLSWLSFGYPFGMETPLILDFKVVYLQFQILFNMNIASILGTIIAIIIYRKI